MDADCVEVGVAMGEELGEGWLECCELGVARADTAGDQEGEDVGE